MLPLEPLDIRLYAPIATLCASSIASFLWWLAKQRKRLSICVLRAEPLIAMRGSARRKLKVLFGNQTMESAYLLHISLLNDGNQPVAKSDYQSPLRIELNPDARIYEADVVETWPADLDRSLTAPGQTVNLIRTVSGSWIELEPILLNSRDEIVLQLLVENFDNHIEISQRITGIKKVEIWKESRIVPKLVTLAGFCVAIFAAFFVEPDAPFNLTFPSIPYVMLLTLGGILIATGFAWPRSERIRQFSSSNTIESELNEDRPQVSVEVV